MDEWGDEDPHASGDDDDGVGFGWGAGMLLGGALAWIFGGAGRRDEDLDFSDELLRDIHDGADLGSLTKEEKVFLSQIWRLEKELEEAVQEKNWEKVSPSFNVCPGRDNPAIADSSSGLQNLGTATNPSSLNAFILCIDSSCSPVFQGLADVSYGHGSDLGCLGRDRVKSTKKVRI